MDARGVGEEVVRLGGPRPVGRMDGLQVAGGGRVQQVEAGQLLLLVLVDVPHQFLQVLEPHVGVLVVEILPWTYQLVIRTVGWVPGLTLPMVRMILSVV